jgi:hypothetical protein
MKGTRASLLQSDADSLYSRVVSISSIAKLNVFDCNCLLLTTMMRYLRRSSKLLVLGVPWMTSPEVWMNMG